FDQGDLSPDHPPWASFGPAQPDPTRKPSGRSDQPPRYPEWPGPYTPDPESGLDNPPYIPKRRKGRMKPPGRGFFLSPGLQRDFSGPVMPVPLGPYTWERGRCL